MKKYFVLILILFFACLNNVKAYVDDDCLNDGSCMLVCNYVNNIKITDSRSSRDLSIYYYHKTGNIKIKWNSLVYSKSPLSKEGAADYVFSKSGTSVYWGISEAFSIENFKCPTYGFLDLDSTYYDNELCFDNDGQTCKKEYSNFGTKFASGPYFTSATKDYDFENELTNYLNNDFEEILDEVSKGNFDIKKDLDSRIEKDFTNYLHGNGIPPFMINSQAYTNFRTNLIERYEKRKEEELKKAEEEKENQIGAAEHQKRKELEELDRDLLKGFITQEEYNEKVAKIEEEYEAKKKEIEDGHQNTTNSWSETSEDLKAQVDLAFNNLKSNIQINQDFKTGECDSYLGNPEAKGSPAYYLQFVFNLIKYAAIIILFVFSIVEMFKAVASSNQDALKKALQATVKRLLIVVVIFFLPSLIKFLLTVLGAYSPSTCGIS